MDVDETPMDTDAPGGSSSGEVPEATVEEPAESKNAGYPGSSSFGEEPIPEMNFSADAANDHDNLYEQGIWGAKRPWS